MGDFEYLEDEAIADIAFKATGKDLNSLFFNAGIATCNLQTDLETLERSKTEEFQLKKNDIERLLNSFLSEILYYKDAEQFFIKDIEVNVRKNGDMWIAEGEFIGSTFDEDKNPRHNDLKAITWHNFYVKEKSDHWECYVLIDI